MITLTHPTGVIALHRDLIWIDRDEWSPITESEEYTVTGGLVVEPWQTDIGRSITLRSDPDYGLIPRALVAELQALDASAGLLEMQLDYHGELYNVAFRRANGAAVSATPLHIAGPPAATDMMQLTLRLRTI